MRIVSPSVTYNVEFGEEKVYEVYKNVERAGRTCYLSEKVEGDTPGAFIQRLLKRGHESVLEHSTISLRFICDRGVSHELVRHRIASYSQESTRYCNYSNGKFGGEITVIKPIFFEEGTQEYAIWEGMMKDAEMTYMDLLEMGRTPQEARSVLPNSLKTEIVVTMNMREWRHFIKLRYLGTTGSPHPQMKEVAKMAFDLLYRDFPDFFEDLKEMEQQSRV